MTVHWDKVSYCNKVLYDIATPRVSLPVMKRQITNINNLELLLDSPCPDPESLGGGGGGGSNFDIFFWGGGGGC